jgi:hypothetical protein
MTGVEVVVLRLAWSSWVIEMDPTNQLGDGEL